MSDIGKGTSDVLRDAIARYDELILKSPSFPVTMRQVKLWEQQRDILRDELKRMGDA